MKKSLCIMLLLCFANLLIAQDYLGSKTYTEGYAGGESYARDAYSAGGWAGAGLAGGFLLGLIGAGIMTGVSQMGSPKPSMTKMLEISEMPEPYKIGFMDGYSKKVKKKRLFPVIAGGVVGTAIAVIVVLNIEKSKD